VDGATAADFDAPPSVVRAPGTYQLSGRVRLDEALVEISGITNAQQISWSPGSISSPVATFTSFEHFAQPRQMPEIMVRGAQLHTASMCSNARRHSANSVPDRPRKRHTQLPLRRGCR